MLQRWLNKPLPLLLALLLASSFSFFISHSFLQSTAAASLKQQQQRHLLLRMTDKAEEPTFRIRPSIVLFGDSITQHSFGTNGEIGWASLVAANCTRRADVLNRGFSGYNTQMAVDQLLPSVFTGRLSSKPLFCTVFFGANDAALPGEKQHVPLDTFRRNLHTIVHHIRATLGKRTPIVLITPPPFEASMWMQVRNRDTPGRSNEAARTYGQAVQDVARELHTLVVDAWTLMEGDNDAQRSSYLCDGLHLNEKGNRALHQGLMAVLAKKHPDILPMEDGNGKYGTTGIPLEQDLWEKVLEDVPAASAKKS